MRDFGKLLLVDDDKTALSLMRELLEGRGYEVDSVSGVDQAENSLEANAYRAVVTDLKMPGRSGLELVDTCRREYPETPVIMITGHGTIRNAVEALKAGAFEYLSKPIQMDELAMVIDKAIKSRRLETQNLFLRDELERTLGFLYETANPQLTEVYRTVEFIKDEDTSVFIQGESGTGKEVIARLIHNSGRRSSGSFVPINCGAIPEGLIESELFGYEKGAFTGAERRTPGKLEIADGGTLFLDEVNELPPRAQVALLRFIQERELNPLGSNRRVSVNVRLITATNQKLSDLVKKGRFREDLYYRINVLPLSLPPLRDRREDIMPLSRWFLKRQKTNTPRLAEDFSIEAAEALENYHWPGNIRELRNVVDRATLICRKKFIEESALLLPGTAD
ncbi:MAG: sigma-54 dependent transcriptional regulator, partial [Spirochaetaceae bacterium]|nr:sigma-54 dependent transcriptional regulator [Spirochaetaceae bacterium]